MLEGNHLDVVRFFSRRLVPFLAIVVVSLSVGVFLLRSNEDDREPLSESVPLAAAIDPKESGWETEVFSDAADKQLKALSSLIANSSGIDERDVLRLVVSTFRCSPLRPRQLQKVFEDHSLTILRARGSGTETGAGFRGVAGAIDALRSLSESLNGAKDIHVKFKVSRVELNPKSATTRVLYQANGRSIGGLVQQNATWRCRWSRSVAGSPPLLEWIGVENYEESVSNSLQGALFTDCTEAVLGNDFSIQEQLLRGTDQWREQLQVDFADGLIGYHGIAVGDVNGDDLEDIYFCQLGGVPNGLLVQNLDGTVTDTAANAGVDWLDRSWGALLLDLDNDGDRDLVVVMDDNILFMANDGAGRFSQRSVFYLKDYAYSLAAADYDNDSNVDIFVTSYGIREPSPYHDANNGHPNILLRNDGHWTFSDVTRGCGLDNNNRRWSFAAAWEDFDNDGDQDLYVANDYGRNNLYRNDGGHFVDVAETAGVEDIASGMSASWGDYDGDGLMDLYVGNMFSSAGGRITYRRRFQSDADPSIRRQFQRLARGNSLFKNAGDGTFRDVSVDAAVTMGRWAWSSKFIDINNDSWEDIFVTNGFITGPDTDDL